MVGVTAYVLFKKKAATVQATANKDAVKINGVIYYGDRQTDIYYDSKGNKFDYNTFTLTYNGVESYVDNYTYGHTDANGKFTGVSANSV